LLSFFNKGGIILAPYGAQDNPYDNMIIIKRCVWTISKEEQIAYYSNFLKKKLFSKDLLVKHFIY